jgi:hypothetical protein
VMVTVWCRVGSGRGFQKHHSSGNWSARGRLARRYCSTLICVSVLAAGLNTFIFNASGLHSTTGVKETAIEILPVVDHKDCFAHPTVRARRHGRRCNRCEKRPS